MREKKYGLLKQSKRKMNYRHLGMVIAAAAAALALIIAAIFIVIHIMSGDPFPEDASLTKEAGSVQTEIDDEAALKLRYPSFSDEQLDQAVLLHQRQNRNMLFQRKRDSTIHREIGLCEQLCRHRDDKELHLSQVCFHLLSIRHLFRILKIPDGTVLRFEDAVRNLFKKIVEIVRIRTEKHTRLPLRRTPTASFALYITYRHG